MQHNHRRLNFSQSSTSLCRFASYQALDGRLNLSIYDQLHSVTGTEGCLNRDAVFGCLDVALQSYLVSSTPNKLAVIFGGVLQAIEDGQLLQMWESLMRIETSRAAAGPRAAAGSRADRFYTFI